MPALRGTGGGGVCALPALTRAGRRRAPRPHADPPPPAAGVERARRRGADAHALPPQQPRRPRLAVPRGPRLDPAHAPRGELGRRHRLGGVGRVRGRRGLSPGGGGRRARGGVRRHCPPTRERGGVRAPRRVRAPGGHLDPQRSAAAGGEQATGAASRRERASAGGDPDRRWLRGHRGEECSAPLRPARGGAGRPHGLHRAPPRRDRYRQGVDRARDPRDQPALGAPDDQGELRRHLPEPCRERAVRPRARRLHRRGSTQGRPLRARRRRDALPRRDRRAPRGRPGQAAPRSPGAGVRAGRRRPQPCASTCG